MPRKSENSTAEKIDMRNIGIFGGTFDPIHCVHVEIAMAAKKFLNLDKIILVPTGNPPHKDKAKVTSFADRFNMVRLAIEDLDGFYVSDIENKSKLKKSYTSDTLDAFASLHQSDQLFFIVGSDSLFDMENWKNPSNIFSKAQIAVFYRPNVSTMEEFLAQKRYLEKKYNTEIQFISNLAKDLSSTEIRTDFKKGLLSVENINSKVKKYAEEHKLYE